MDRIRVFCCVLVLLLCAALPAGAEREIPKCLRFEQEMVITKLPNDRNVYVTKPVTAKKQVTKEIAAVVDELYAAAEPHLQKTRSYSLNFEFADRLDVGPYITRVGSRWMSFLTIARVTHGADQIYVAFDTRVFNMETGERVYLDSIIDAEKGGWEFLSEEAKRQLAAHFPALEPDPEVLDALCSPEALKNAAFTLSPGHITLRWHAHDLYPDAPEGLLRTDIYYPALKPYMTETALEETDCSGYALAALTYDDGPGRNSSDSLMNQLRIYGAEATFFAIGVKMDELPCVLHREYDAGYSVQSHNWVHEYTAPTAKELAEWTRLTDETLSAIIGVGPTKMRSPGGNELNYINAGVTLPLIHWSMISGDSEAATQNDIRGVARHTAMAKDGDIVLCHDGNSKAGQYAQGYLPKLINERNYLLVTLEDLCVLRGAELLPAEVYNSFPPKKSIFPAYPGK